MPFPLALGMIPGKTAMVLGMVCIVLVGSNVMFYKFWQGEVRASGGYRAERDSAISQGKACSDATNRLREEARERERAVQAALRQARAAAQASERKALETLQIEPVKPDDFCVSALELSRQMILERHAQ